MTWKIDFEEERRHGPQTKESECIDWLLTDSRVVSSYIVKYVSKSFLCLVSDFCVSRLVSRLV